MYLSICEAPIETVKQIWVNILYMLDWIFLTKLQKFTSFAYSWSTSEECKILYADAPDELLAVSINAGSYQIEGYKN